MTAAIKSIRRAGEILYFPTAALHQGKPQNSFAAAPWSTVETKARQGCFGWVSFFNGGR